MTQLGKKLKPVKGVKRIIVAVVLFIASCLLIINYVKTPEPQLGFGAFGIGIILSVMWALYLIWFSKVCEKKKR